MKQAILRIGTRSSALALAQTQTVCGRLQDVFPAAACELVPMLTSGDRTRQPLADIGGKGLFTRELQQGLLDGSIDMAVHSLKDMETRLPRGLMIAAVLPREDPRDALLAPGGMTLQALPAGTRVGTSSPRRTALLAIERPDIAAVPLRGNVNTRIARLKAGEVEAAVLALAGLRRLKLEAEATEILDASRFIPAAGQGTIAIECREGNERVRSMLATIHDETNFLAVQAERSVLLAIGGSCRTPVGAYARIIDNELHLDALLAAPDNSGHARLALKGSPQDAEAIGREAGLALLARSRNGWR